MIIGVDAGCLSVTDTRLKAGVYYVVYNLLKELAKIDKENTYLLYSFQPIDRELLRQFPKYTKNIVLPSFGWLYVSLPLSFLFQRPDVFLATSQAMPWYHPFKTVGFIHGLDFVQAFHPLSNTKLKKNSEYLIRHANTLVTTSAFLKESLKVEYKKSNVVSVPLGADEVFAKSGEIAKPKIPYFLFVGTLKPSKNVTTVMKAFLEFQKQSKKKYKLLLIGSDFWLDEELKQLLDSKHTNIHVISSRPQRQLVGYYKGAIALVSPSLYEGFGMTFLEAMKAGCAVIGSTVGALPEIVGKAGILVEPTDVKGLAKAMGKVATDRSYRLLLIRKGKVQAKKYSWKGFAKNIYPIITS